MKLIKWGSMVISLEKMNRRGDNPMSPTWKLAAMTPPLASAPMTLLTRRARLAMRILGLEVFAVRVQGRVLMGFDEWVLCILG
jgi:hypothetical protein